MALYQLPTRLAAETGIKPATVKAVSTDDLATVTTAGYMNAQNLQGFEVKTSDVIEMIFSYDEQADKGTLTFLEVSITNGVIKLDEYNPAGGVNATLPTAVNRIAVYSNTTGDITQDASGAVNGGDIQAGLDGTGGSLISMAPTSARGHLRLEASDNAGAFNVLITNDSMGQTTALNIPDPGNSNAQMCVAGAPLVDGNLVSASGSAGLLQDLGSRVIAQQSALWAGGSTANAFTLNGVTSSSVIVASIISATNICSIIKVEPGTNQARVHFSTDPGANTQIAFIAMTAAVA